MVLVLLLRLGVMTLEAQFPATDRSDPWIFRGELTTDRVQTTLLEVRLAEAQPTPGLTAATVRDSGARIFLRDERLITNNDVLEASVVEAAGRFSVAITLTPDGADRMASATSTHIGKPLALIVEGEVTSAPIVRSTIRNQAMITGDFTRAQAETIASGLRR
jgi:preprotein translocase subunit SecD